MHEHGMCEGLVDLIRRQAGDREITGARVRVGTRHAVVGEAFDQAFAHAAAGTPAENAVLDLVVTPLTVTCRACGGRTESLDVLAVCPVCGGDDVDLTGGDELVLESISYREEPAHVPGHPG
ncbi:hydrogenase maturation nickel metallochaperone HypA [Nonomuraea cavernae]|uniref:hydrogenase maturation nickel metallochaperone HypA/HybF n=1 Tax=Nonomuraea cavernae TaxID=2045107 RepID=UPI0033E94D44